MLLEDRPLEAEGAVNMEVKLRLLKYPVPKGLGCQDHCCGLVSVAMINTTTESNLGGRGLLAYASPSQVLTKGIEGRNLSSSRCSNYGLLVAPHGSLSAFSDSPGPQPPGSITQRGRGLPLQSVIKRMPTDRPIGQWKQCLH